MIGIDVIDGGTRPALLGNPLGSEALSALVATVDTSRTMSDALDDQQITVSGAALRALRDEFQRFLMEYRFGLAEVETKISILREEFQRCTRTTRSSTSRVG